MFLKRLVDFFDRLNTLKAVLIVLALALAVNGFLLYRQAASPLAPVAPSSSTAPYEATVPVEGTEEPAPAVPETQEEPSATAPPEESPPAVSETFVPETPVAGGLEEVIAGCEEDRECVREAIAGATGARYIGGRLDLASGSGRNREVLYFEAPDLEPCEHVKQEYETTGGLIYTVIVVGQGSFDSERGSECIPAS